MDAGSSSDNVHFYIADFNVSGADLDIGFQVSGGNRHAFVSCGLIGGGFATVDTVVATDGAEHTLKAVIDGLNLSLYMDGILLGYTVATAPLIDAFDFTFVSIEKGVPASSVYASKVEVSICPEAFPPP